MASIIQIGARWRAQVRRKGMPHKTQSFPSKESAAKWAESVESSIRQARVDGLNALAEQPPFTWLAVDPFSIQRFELERFCGIYFLFREGILLYIGQAVNVPRRVEEHFRKKGFDSWSWIPVPPSKLTEAETFLIRKFRPALNVTFNRSTAAHGRKLAMATLQPA
jgi:hypothetical protein